MGKNRESIEHEIPHISSLMHYKIEEVLLQSEIIVICKPEQEYMNALMPFLGEKIVFDLARISPEIANMPKGYEVICW